MMADTLSFNAKIGVVDIPKWPSKTWNGIVHHKSDRKLCVIPTADRNTWVWHMFFGKGLWWVVPTYKIHRIWFIWVSIDPVDLCQTHCKQVPDFSCPAGSDQVNTRGFPPWLCTKTGCVIQTGQFMTSHLHFPLSNHNNVQNLRR